MPKQSSSLSSLREMGGDVESDELRQDCFRVLALYNVLYYLEVFFLSSSRGKESCRLSLPG
jgi:capsule polysaccharide modification protein KpsS